jgi:integrase
MSIPYAEGSVFLVPLKNGGYARGVYTRREVEAILTTPSQPPERVFLMAVYAFGLRISEATRLKTSDIDRARMQLRVRNGKGAKERVLLIEPKSLRVKRVRLANRVAGASWLDPARFGQLPDQSNRPANESMRDQP